MLARMAFESFPRIDAFYGVSIYNGLQNRATC